MEQPTRFERSAGLTASIIEIGNFLVATGWTLLTLSAGFDVGPVGTTDISNYFDGLSGATAFWGLLFIELILAYVFAKILGSIYAMWRSDSIDLAALVLAGIAIMATSGWVSSFTVKLYAGTSFRIYITAGAFIAAVNGLGAFVGILGKEQELLARTTWWPWVAGWGHYLAVVLMIGIVLYEMIESYDFIMHMGILAPIFGPLSLLLLVVSIVAAPFFGRKR